MKSPQRGIQEYGLTSRVWTLGVDCVVLIKSPDLAGNPTRAA